MPADGRVGCPRCGKIHHVREGRRLYTSKPLEEPEQRCVPERGRDAPVTPVATAPAQHGMSAAVLVAMVAVVGVAMLLLLRGRSVSDRQEIMIPQSVQNENLKLWTTLHEREKEIAALKARLDEATAEVEKLRRSAAARTAPPAAPSVDEDGSAEPKPAVDTRVAAEPKRAAPWVSKALQAMVRVKTENAGGAGFVVGSEGLVVAPFAVVSSTREILVERVEKDDGGEWRCDYRAEVIAVSAERDLALLKVAGVLDSVLPLAGKAPLAEGDRAVVLDRTLEKEGGVVEGRIVRPAYESGGRRSVQTDLQLESRHIGSPVLNDQGQVIGIVAVLCTDPKSGSLAIPVDRLRKLLDEAAKKTTSAPVTVESPGVSPPGRLPKKFVDRITFPIKEEQENWAGKGAEYQDVMEFVMDRGQWLESLKRVEKVLGPMKDAWKLNVTFRETAGGAVDGALACAGRREDEGTMTFFLGALVANRRQQEERREIVQKLWRDGVVGYWGTPWKEERLHDHELTHILQGEYAERAPLWFLEGMAEWVADDLSMVIDVQLWQKKEVELIDGYSSGIDVYWRGMLFFKWLESKVKRDGIRKLYEETCIQWGDWKKVIELLVDMKWEQIIHVENKWSREYARDLIPRVWRIRER
ncbi:MAG: trypsin-like peptidase domain-containing protein [Planctomycetes bacterium]|nr:trypsin-like peptidase domain-containing protein [Planctomycetota bacterium]